MGFIIGIMPMGIIVPIWGIMFGIGVVCMAALIGLLGR